jgi:hypothetical protein
MEGVFYIEERGMISVKQNKPPGKKGETLTLQAVPASSLFHEKSDIPPIRTISSNGDEIEESVGNLNSRQRKKLGLRRKKRYRWRKASRKKYPTSLRI